MHICVYGAGVIGCYLAHVLCQCGHDVTVLARGAWGEILRTEGLTIRHHLQRKTTVDHPTVISVIDGERFDAVFAVMPCHQMQAALPDLAKLSTKLLVLVGNNLRSEASQQTLRDAGFQGHILFGFQATAGSRGERYLICERAGAGGMDIGALGQCVPEQLQRRVERIFANSPYKLHWQPDMHPYFLCHVAAILPIAYLTYACDGNLRLSTATERRRIMQASREGYDLLHASGYPIYPVGDDAYYRTGPKAVAMYLLYTIMAKTEIGDLVACAHCRHAVSEMEQLDADFLEVMRRSPGSAMPAWRALRAAMPSWAELHALYPER